jgi:thioesterase domain-containing protein
MGGISACEMAQQLRAQGEVVEHLLLFDCEYPSPENAAYANPAQWMHELSALHEWFKDGVHLDLQVPKIALK